MELSIVLGLIVGLGYTAAFMIYNRKAFSSGKTDPNVTTWAIWSMIVLVGTPNYLVATGDWWKSVIPLLNTVLCTGTFFRVFIHGKFKKPNVWEWGALLLSAVAVVIWIRSGSAAYANIALNGAIILGFLPTWIGIAKCKAKEDPLPWWIWTLSYGLAALVVVMRWKGQWIDLLYPTNCIFLHASVPLLAAWRGRKFLKGKWSGVFLGFRDGFAVCWIDIGDNLQVKTGMPAHQFRCNCVQPGSTFVFDWYILVELVPPKKQVGEDAVEQMALEMETDLFNGEWIRDVEDLTLNVE